MTTNSGISPFPVILQLGDQFYDQVQAVKFPKAQARFLNSELADELGVLADSKATSVEWAKYFHRFEPLPNNLNQHLALRYHGHQFRKYNPELGDGRGFMYAQFRTDSNQLLDLNTKGSGTTPYSRKGDGRLTLKGAIREVLAAEMLQSLGVHTNKVMAIFETGEELSGREEPGPIRSAVMTRLSHGHVRIGTFQRFVYLKDLASLKSLYDYSCQYLFPEENLLQLDEPDRMKRFFEVVCLRQARLAAELMMTGFVHGVLNTDNINITGECFDYGLFRFLEEYNPFLIAARFDPAGMYAYGHQPQAIFWNLKQMAVCLKTLDPKFDPLETLKSFNQNFSQCTLDVFLKRLNLKSNGPELDDQLLSSFFSFMRQKNVMFEQTFFDLHSGFNFGVDLGTESGSKNGFQVSDEGRINIEKLERSPQKKAYLTPLFHDLFSNIIKHQPAIPELVNSVYFKQQKPCTLFKAELEEIWTAIHEKDNWQLFENKIQEIRSFRGIY